ncbi:MAG TPA: hypothetical protein VGO56_03485 [Pyrinomonadaceae bacterium]|jgi:hypothetical protein|nr:hypothetical protein [Pyrinomonadaceae bacterium]
MFFPRFSRSLFKPLFTISVLVFLGTTRPVGAATIVVPGGGDFQAAINAANCGDEIILQAGATFAGNFTLRYKGPCTGTDADYITIRTSSLSGITPAGTRITPAQSSSMPTVLANSANPALEAEANAHHYKLIGINFVNVGGSIFTPEIITIGKRSSGGDIPFAQHPHHIVFDRDWIHEATNDTTTPDSAATTSDRGMDINANDVVVTECRIAGFRAYLAANGPGSAEASNAILFPYSALRVTVSNSYLEAWFAPVFFGGSGGETTNRTTIANPTFNPITSGGSATFSTVQNLNVGDFVAFKTTGGTQPPGAVCSNCPCLVQIAMVTAISGNMVSYVGAGAKGDLNKGNPLRQVPDAPGDASWNGYLNQDITVQRSQIVLNFNSTEWEWINSGGDPTTLPRSQQLRFGHGPKGFIEIKMARNVSIFGNTFEGWHNALVLTARNQGSTITGNAFPWSGLFNVNITNNYFKRTPNWNRQFSGVIGGPALEDSEFTTVRSGPVTISNNLFDSGVEEILLSMTSADNVTLTHNTYPGSATPLGRASMIFAHTTTSNGFIFKDNILANNEYGMNCQSGPTDGCWSNLQMAHNVIIDNRTDGGKIGDGPLNSRYPNDLIAPSLAAVGWVDPANANYSLAANSPYKAQGSAGADPGVDMEQLLAALGGTLAPPSPTPTPTPSATPTPTPNPSPSPTPAPGGSGETVWLSGALPAGATPHNDSDGWTWNSNNPVPYAAPLAHQSIVATGAHQHYFTNASTTLTLNSGDVLFTYVYLDPASPPSEIMLQWSTNSVDFDHRAYWGGNGINWGTDGTEGRRYMGPLPPTGQWVRLEVPVNQVGLEGKTINGMAFTLYGGKASWDRSGKAGASAAFRIVTSTDGSGEAIAMNLAKQTNGFEVLTQENFGSDKRTRVALFTMGISSSAVNSDTTNDVGGGGAGEVNFAESVAVEARRSNGQIVMLPVEFAGAADRLVGHDQVNLRLPEEMRAAGVVSLTLIVAGQRSNAATILIR